MTVRTVQLSAIADSPFCVDVVDGQRVHDEIATSLQKGEKVAVSFRGVDRLTTAFLNAAIGQLYNEFSEDTVRTSLTVTDAQRMHLDLLKRVTERAKSFFSQTR